MDAYIQARSVPLIDVLRHFGFSGWKHRKNGTEHYGKCPEHQPTKNKTSFSFTREKWNCFSCGWSGTGAIDMCMALGKLQFKQAVELLEKLAGTVHVEQTITETKSTRTENPPFKGTYHKYFQPSEWLAKRGLTQKTLDLFGVGLYNNPNRKSIYSNKVLFSIRRFRDGEQVAYLSRDISGEDGAIKYSFPKGFHKQLEVFGAWQIKQLAEKAGASNASGERVSNLALPLRVGFVVESPLCVMKYWQLGLYAVSCFGAFVSEQQLEIIQHLFRGVIYLPDRDKTDVVGASLKALSSCLWLKAPALPAEISDPENLNREQILALVKSA
jgi:DNA primase